MSIPYNNSIANPSPGHYDPRNDLGYGKTQNNPIWNMGDPLSAPKGQWDNDLEQIKDEEDIDKIDVKINKKIHVALNKQHVDSLKKRDKNSFNGLSNTMQHLGATYESVSNKKENLLKEYIKETILSETGLGISGNIAVASRPKGKNLGNKSRHYHIDNTTLGSMGSTNAGGIINSKGYKKGVDHKQYASYNTYELKDDIEEDWSEEYESTSDFYNQSQEELDIANVKNKKNNTKFNIYK
ncbi:hypothetical protein [Winogradskyella sp.]|uniref:hypothetical protein n=1 Tax=Winogradskyella sp. TaxID=1883156 RepID=UPI003F6A0508